MEIKLLCILPENPKKYWEKLYKFQKAVIFIYMNVSQKRFLSQTLSQKIQTTNESIKSSLPLKIIYQNCLRD